jgi:hypothetical protein
MSHTVTVDVKMKDRAALIKAAEAMGAQVIGEGNHNLYSSSHTGLGIKLTGWQFPVVVTEDGVIHYDDFNGRWGNPNDIKTLTDDYAMRVVEAECENLGWYTEKQENGELVVHHPSGGTILVGKGGHLDAQGFHGTSCSEATLKLEQAMGLRLGESVKPEMNEVQLTQNEVSE